jgi:hypothetical protein
LSGASRLARLAGAGDDVNAEYAIERRDASLNAPAALAFCRLLVLFEQMPHFTQDPPQPSAGLVVLLVGVCHEYLLSDCILFHDVRLLSICVLLPILTTGIDKNGFFC